MRKISVLLFFLFSAVAGLAADWGNTKPIIDSLIEKYESMPDYHTVFVDELILANGSADDYKDTTIAYKSGDSSILFTSDMIVLNTNAFTLRINNETQEIYYQEHPDENSRSKASDVKLADMMEMMEICDSLRLTSNASNNRVIEAYLEGSMVPKTKMVFDNNYIVKQIWRYYADQGEYQAQRIRFLVFEEFDNDDAGVFDIAQYISLANMTPAGVYSAYTLYVAGEQ